jgi:hypothetical protein
VHRFLFKVHQVDIGLFPEIVEIEALRLPIFVVCNHKIGNGLGLRRDCLSVASLLALGLTLSLFLALLLTSPLFLPLSKCCTRTSSHMNIDYAYVGKIHSL